MTTIATKEEHRSFLNQYYGLSRHFYDVTRKYYLFGRDRELQILLSEDWSSLVEIGPGTGRNLRKLYQFRSDALYGGVEASDEMLVHSRERCAFARLSQGFAEEAPLSTILGMPPERILFSYCLSMIQKPLLALENALSHLPENGEICIVDFADFEGLPRFTAQALRKWLTAFHVSPIDSALLAPMDAKISYGPGRYYLRARLSKRRWLEAQG